MKVKVIDLPPADLVAGTDVLLLEQNSGTKNTTVTKLISDLGLVTNTTLAANSAAQRIGTKSGNNVQVELDKIKLNATQTQDEIAQVQTSVAEIESKQEALDQFNIDLQSPSGADLIQTSNGNTVQEELNNNLLNDREQWRRSLAEAGLTLVDGSFEDGATLNTATDAIWHISGGQCYTWGGDFPKIVTKNSTPESTGISWSDVTDKTVTAAVYAARDAAVAAQHESENAAAESKSYVLQASEVGNMFPDEPTGLAATANGQFFQVPQGSGGFISFKLFKNNNGVAEEVARVPGTAAITGTIREFPTLAAAQADADAGNILSGATAFYRSPDDSALAIEVVNNAGTLTATGRKMPSYDSLKRSNILFDAFNEQSAEQLNFASWDWYKGATPTFSTSDSNLPLPTPVIQVSGVTSFDKYYDVSKLQVKPGDTLTFSVLVWFENAGGKLQIYWLDSAGATITIGEASPLVAGISSPVVVIAVPSGASSIRIRVQNTVPGAFKIGAYAAAIGDVTPEFTRSFPSKAYQEALGTPDNLVYDPFGEMLSVRPKQGLPAGVVDAMSYAGTLIQNSANSPWGKTGIQNTSGVGADRIISLSSMGVKPGDTITVRLAAWFASTGGTFQVFCRNASEVLSSATIAASASGFNDGSTTLTIPAGATYLTVRAAGSMVKELLAVGIAFGRSRPEFIYGSLPAEYSGYQRQQINLWPDPWYRRYECGETHIDGWGPAQVAGVSLPAYVADYSGSPFLRKKSLIIPVGGGQTDINISAKRLGLRAGDSLTVALGVVSSQAINVAAYFRTASGTVISDSSSQLFQFPTQQYQTLVRTIAITQEIVDTAGYLQIRLMNRQTVGPAGVYIVARGLFVGNGSPVLSDDTYRQDADFTTSRTFTLNQDSLRETHKRLMSRKLSQSATLVTAHIGDSWTHLWNRWSGIFAGKMQDDYGSAGIGYIGFGYPSEAGFGQYNGNILGQITLTKTGTWTPTYATAQSADICSVSSSDTSATFRANGIPANASSVRLFAKPQGSVKYSTDGGANWTTIDLSTFTDLAVVSLTVPSTAFNIWFSPVSGTVELYGLDVQTATDGVRSHKLGATGSSAKQWAAQVTSTTWQKALTALAPNLVTILHGTNDQTSSRDPAAFAADIQTIITAVRTACPLADILVLMPCENQRNNNVAMAAYASVVRDVCALNKVAYHNLQIDYGDKPSDYASTSPRNWFNADGIHPDPATGGGLPIVSAVLKLM